MKRLLITQNYNLMKYFFKWLFTLALLFIPFVDALAQPLPPTSTPVPLDGGLVVLLAVGAAYGFRKNNENSIS